MLLPAALPARERHRERSLPAAAPLPCPASTEPCPPGCADVVSAQLQLREEKGPSSVPRTQAQLGPRGQPRALKFPALHKFS